MKIFDILKARWPEAVMVAGLQACCVALLKDLQNVPQPQTDFARLFFLGVGAAIFSIISQMLFWGFVRSAAVEGIQPAEPMALLRIGRMYFWKLLLFQLMLLPVVLLIILVIQGGAQMLLYGKMESEPPLWLSVAGAAVVGLVLMKPAYLIPAMILLRDYRIWDALRNLRQLRMLEMRHFMIITVSVLVAAGAAEYISGLVGRQEILYYPALALYALVSAVGMLLVFLAAVMGVEQQMPREVPDAQAGSEINES
jgi:uncharacterized integral membrane protein